MIVVERIESAHLADNLLGNPSARDLVVYLPPSYERDHDRRYPVVYLLHNFYSRAVFWPFGPALDFGALHRPIQEVLDEAIAAKRMDEMIVAMPDGWSAFGCSLWVDSPVTGRFEQYVVHDVVARVDATFRTFPETASRGIGGHGAGGFGAWHIGSRNPEIFGAIAMLSADLDFELAPRSRFYTYYNSIFPNPPSGVTRGNLPAWFCYGWSTALTPNVDNFPYYCDFPIEYPSGDVLPEHWERFCRHDPLVSWQTRVEELKRLRGLWMDVGFRDEFHLHYAQRTLSARLTSAGIPHDADEFDGTNTSHIYHRIPLAFTWFSEILARTPRP